VTCIWERCIWGFGGEHKERRPLGRCRKKWEDNVVWDFKEIGPI